MRDPNHPTLKFNVSCNSCSSSVFKFNSVPMARTKCRASTYQRKGNKFVLFSKVFFKYSVLCLSFSHLSACQKFQYHMFQVFKINIVHNKVCVAIRLNWLVDFICTESIIIAHMAALWFCSVRIVEIIFGIDGGAGSGCGVGNTVAIAVAGGRLSDFFRWIRL